tara:strand:+ start:490 stop:810 length:321 start_codon:yes stop_codon:yes gene_type:complete
MKPACCWKQWATIAFATLILMIGRVAIGDTPPKDDEADLRQLMEQMEAYQNEAPVIVPAPDAGPQHPTPRERSLEADLAEMQHRAVMAEEALATCQSEVASLRRPQ